MELRKPFPPAAAPSVAATDPDPARWRPRGKILMVLRLLGGRAGGAERLFCDTANLFADAGYEVTVLYCDHQQQPPAYRLSPKVTRVNLWSKPARTAAVYRALDRAAALARSTPVAPPVDWLSKNLYFLRRLYIVARDLDPDVIISYLPPANTPALLAGWLAGRAVIPTNHSVPQHDFASDTRWDQNPIDKHLRLWSLKLAERVHVMFPGFVDWFPDDIRAKAVAIPNFLSDEFFAPEPPRPRRKEIVAAGRLAAIKNYDQLIEAWSMIAPRHPTWSVRIYGTGPARKALAAKIRERGVVASLHLMGQTTDMKRAYLEGEIFCHPAAFEGFGLSAAEALACGLPVVAYADCAGLDQFVRDGDNGLLVDRAGGPRALADGLERLIADSALRERLRRRAPESVRPFSRDAFRDRWIEIIDGIVARRRRTP